MVELGLKILWCNSILFVHCRASDFFGAALIRGPIQLPQTPQNFKWLTVLSVPLSLSPKLLFGQRLQNCVRNNIPYYFFRWMKFWLKKKCRGISLVPLYFLKNLMQYILLKKWDTTSSPLPIKDTAWKWEHVSHFFGDGKIYFFTTLPLAHCWWAGYASPQPRKEASRGHLSWVGTR